MIKRLFASLSAVALCAVAPSALAQTPAAETAAPDPARVAAAKPVIDQLWPTGTYRRIMEGTMSEMMDSMFDGMFGMSAKDFGATDAAEGQTMGDAMLAKDPAFRERMKISTDIMFAEMLPLMEKVEPSIRENLVQIYARRFSLVELTDMAAFFATPSGKSYADQSMMLFMDPEMMKSMTAFTPDLIQAMPAIMAKVEAATAHLPPPPAPDYGDAAGEAAAEAAEAAMAAADGEYAEAEPYADYPWEDPANWTDAERAEVERLEAEADTTFGLALDARSKAIEAARTRLESEK